MTPPTPPRPALTADAVVLTRREPRQVLLIERAHDPFAGVWALPGGFVEEGERTRDAAIRELYEETGLRVDDVTLLGVYDAPGRDPRGWTVSAVHLALVGDAAPVAGGDDARRAVWHPAGELPPLAFDHAQIVADALAAAA